MAVESLLSWSVIEYEKRHKGVDWFWGVGIVTIAVSLIAIVFGNILFGILILVSGGALIGLGFHHPRPITYHITTEGILEGEQFFPFKNIRSFSVNEDDYTRPTLLIEVSRWFLPVVSIPLPDHAGSDSVRGMLRGRIRENDELKEPMFHYLLDILGL